MSRLKARDGAGRRTRGAWWRVEGLAFMFRLTVSLARGVPRVMLSPTSMSSVSRAPRLAPTLKNSRSGAPGPRPRCCGGLQPAAGPTPSVDRPRPPSAGRRGAAVESPGAPLLRGLGCSSRATARGRQPARPARERARGGGREVVPARLGPAWPRRASRRRPRPGARPPGSSASISASRKVGRKTWPSTPCPC